MRGGTLRYCSVRICVPYLRPPRLLLWHDAFAPAYLLNAHDTTGTHEQRTVISYRLVLRNRGIARSISFIKVAMYVHQVCTEYAYCTIQNETINVPHANRYICTDGYTYIQMHTPGSRSRHALFLHAHKLSFGASAGFLIKWTNKSKLNSVQ